MKRYELCRQVEGETEGLPNFPTQSTNEQRSSSAIQGTIRKSFKYLVGNGPFLVADRTRTDVETERRLSREKHNVRGYLQEELGS